MQDDSSPTRLSYGLSKLKLLSRCGHRVSPLCHAGSSNNDSTPTSSIFIFSPRVLTSSSSGPAVRYSP